MAEYSYSLLAEADADAIAAYTVNMWGGMQASRYIGGLEALCLRLAEGHAAGRICDDLSPGLFRIEYVSHVVFFRLKPYGIRVVRILHQRQLPGLHSFEDDEFDDGE